MVPFYLFQFSLYTLKKTLYCFERVNDILSTRKGFLMKRFLILSSLLFVLVPALTAGPAEECPFLKKHKRDGVIQPAKPPLTFYWILANIPGRNATVWPTTAAISGCFLAPAGYMTCSLEDCSPASAAMLSIGSALWFYSASCVVAACVVTDTPKKQS